MSAPKIKVVVQQGDKRAWFELDPEDFWPDPDEREDKAQAFLEVVGMLERELMEKPEYDGVKP